MRVLLREMVTDFQLVPGRAVDRREAQEEDRAIVITVYQPDPKRSDITIETRRVISKR